LTALEVGFVSLSEALDLTTPSGRALAGMLAVFAEFERDILRDRVKAGIDQARKDGKPHGRPVTAGKLLPEMKQLRKDGLSKRAIATSRKRSSPYRGRDLHRGRPPAQIPAGVIHAPGSHLGCLAAKRMPGQG